MCGGGHVFCKGGNFSHSPFIRRTIPFTQIWGTVYSDFWASPGAWGVVCHPFGAPFCRWHRKGPVSIYIVFCNENDNCRVSCCVCLLDLSFGEGARISCGALRRASVVLRFWMGITQILFHSVLAILEVLRGRRGIWQHCIFFSSLGFTQIFLFRPRHFGGKEGASGCLPDHFLDYWDIFSEECLLEKIALP